MMQLTEARWSPSVRRIAVTTVGFLPVSFVLLIVLFAGRDVLYSWVSHPIAVKAAWLNTKFFFGRTLVLAAVLFVVCFAFAAAILRDSVPPGDARVRVHRNRLATVLLFLWLITVSLWGFDLLMSLDPHWYSGLFGGYFAVSSLYTAFCLLALLTVRANARGLAAIPPAAVPRATSSAAASASTGPCGRRRSASTSRRRSHSPSSRPSPRRARRGRSTSRRAPARRRPRRPCARSAAPTSPRSRSVARRRPSTIASSRARRSAPG
jgi:hypothetical protein